MNIRKFKSDVDKLKSEGERIVKSNDDAKFIHKVTLVNLMLNGMKASDLAKSCGECERTLSLWVQKVDLHGFGALRTRKQPGRTPSLSDEQKESIKDALQKDPHLYGYNVWDGPSLSDYIMREFSVSLQVRQCQRLLHGLGFSLIRPQTFPSKGQEDSPGRVEFKKN